MIRRLLLAVALVAVAPRFAAAHVASDGFVELAVDGATVSGHVDLAARDLHDALDLDDGDGALTWAEVVAREDAIRGYVARRVTIAGCPLVTGALSAIDRVDGMHVAVALAGRCAAAPRALRLDYRAVFDLDAQHRGLVTVATAAGTTAAVIAAPGTITLDLAAPSTDLLGFVREGVWHIWIGLDHVLFLLALLLPAVLGAGRLRDVLADVAGVVTAFTLAHSITLVIAALGWVTLPARLVEAAIAISVALAALNNLVRVVEARWAVGFALGLLHGFGFSSVLAEVGLPGDRLVAALLAFNLGVELGQAVIVAGLVPLAFVARRTAGYRLFLYASSATIAAIAAHWSIERLTA